MTAVPISGFLSPKYTVFTIVVHPLRQSCFRRGPSLTVNETETQLRHVPDESFDFLSYTIDRCYPPNPGRVCNNPSACTFQSNMTDFGSLSKP